MIVRQWALSGALKCSVSWPLCCYWLLNVLWTSKYLEILPVLCPWWSLKGTEQSEEPALRHENMCCKSPLLLRKCMIYTLVNEIAWNSADFHLLLRFRGREHFHATDKLLLLCTPCCWKLCWFLLDKIILWNSARLSFVPKSCLEMMLEDILMMFFYIEEKDLILCLKRGNLFLCRMSLFNFCSLHTYNSCSPFYPFCVLSFSFFKKSRSCAIFIFKNPIRKTESHFFIFQV